jgi:uncharacterized membrane protein YgcG
MGSPFILEASAGNIVPTPIYYSAVVSEGVFYVWDVAETTQTWPDGAITPQFTTGGGSGGGESSGGGSGNSSESSATPEPGPLAFTLTGIGLIAVSSIARRRRTA